MGERFQRLGYDTAYIGKWHLDGAGYFGSGNCPDGWDDETWYDGARYLADLGDHGRALRLSMYGEHASDAALFSSSQWLREQQIDRHFTWAGRNTDRAIEFLRRRRRSTTANRPLLLVVSYEEPNGPYISPPEFVERFSDFEYPVGPAAFDSLEGKPASHAAWARDLCTIPPDLPHFPIQRWPALLDGVRTNGVLRNPSQFACNAFVDQEIGRVIDAVTTLLSEDTVVFFTSDHGDMNGAHGLINHGPAMYEESIRVPLIVSSRSQEFTSGPRSQTVSNLDILPTMLSLAGSESHRDLDGTELTPILSDADAEGVSEAVVQYHRYETYQDGWGGWQPIRCLVEDRWKLVINLNDCDELYDLNKDPSELTNLIREPGHSAIRDDLYRRLTRRMQASEDLLRGSYWRDRYPSAPLRELPWMWRPVIDDRTFERSDPSRDPHSASTQT